MTRMSRGVALLAWLLSAATGCGTDLEPPVVATVTVTPGAATLAFLGESAAFTATATDQYGNPFAGTVAWTSDAPNVFTVSPAGVATAVSNGAGTIRAQVDGVSGTATVTVSQKPTAVERAAGDAQRGRPGTPLVKPLVARVLDAGGSPVAGTAVFFSPADGSGLVAPGTAPTDMAGEARASWTLGDDFGPQSLVASVADGANAVFTATAQRPDELADSVEVVSGDGQGARPGKGLRQPIVVRVLDEHGVPVDGATVLFEAPPRHGFADPGSVRSDRQGQAVTTWTLGDKVGLQLLTASVPGGPSARLAATASVGVCERTPRIRDALVKAAGVSACDEVTDTVLNEIRELDLVSKGIERLDEGDFAGLSSLQYLSLDFNRLAELPSGVFAGLSSLEGLSLAWNRLAELPIDAFAGLSNLGSLQFYENQIAHLPLGVFNGLPNLSTLSLKNNELAKLVPGLFSGMPYLSNLDLSGNRLVEMPAGGFSEFKNLWSLELSANALVDIPLGTFAGLSNLRTLGLAGNGFVDIPLGTFAGLSNLRGLYLGGNQLDLRPGVFAGLSLEVLDLSNNQLTELPVGVLAGLSHPALHLYLDGNRLHLRSGVFAGLPNVVGLYLNENELTDLPVGTFAGLPSLEDLRLIGNHLTDLPVGVFEGLSSLKRLDLSNNRLTDLPVGVLAGLSSVVGVILDENQLTDLPVGVFEGLSNLKDLDLSGNQMTVLTPDAIRELRSLADLRVNDNQLFALSANVFSGLDRLCRVWLENNPGSPFPLQPRIERTDTTDLAAPGPATAVVRLDEGAPFDMEMTLLAPGATLAPAMATIPTGANRSDPFTVTANSGTLGSVTVSLGDLPAIPEEESDCRRSSDSHSYKGITVTAGDPIELFR